MSAEKIETLIVGGGQAGLAMSEHLSKHGKQHLIVERRRIAESWRSARWDSLVANGPAWHDRFPTLAFDDIDPHSFPHRDRIVSYFETFAEQIKAPIRCGVEVLSVERRTDGRGFIARTQTGAIEATNLVAATGPFQKPFIPTAVPADIGIMQIHSSAYRNPGQLPEGPVLVVGAGSSGVQIADELLRAGRRVYLSVGPHDRPPIRYRGKDFCWWLGVLGQWDAKTREPGMEHVTIAVSGAHGGRTIDFRNLAERGMTLLGRIGAYKGGILEVAPDLAKNIAGGDKNYLATLDKADAYVTKMGLDLPEEPDARTFGPDPDCVKNPLRQLDLNDTKIAAIIWATGYTLDFNWLKVDAFDAKGRPDHDKGVSKLPGLYFLGLPWLSCRASAFIWGVWKDASHIAAHITAK